MIYQTSSKFKIFVQQNTALREKQASCRQRKHLEHTHMGKDLNKTCVVDPCTTWV